MIKLLLVPSLMAAWLSPTEADRIDGKTTYYRAGLMRDVAEYWGYADEHPGALFVALNRRGDRGREVWVKWKGAIYRAISVDWAQRGAHFERRERLGLVLEVPRWLAKQWRMRGPIGPVTVFFKPPALRPI